MDVAYIDTQVARYLGATTDSVQHDCLHRIGTHVDLIHPDSDSFMGAITDTDRDRVLGWLENHHYRVQNQLIAIVLKPITIKSNNGTVVESLEPGTSLRLIKPSVLKHGGIVKAWYALYGGEIFNIAVSEPDGESILKIQPHDGK